MKKKRMAVAVNYLYQHNKLDEMNPVGILYYRNINDRLLNVTHNVKERGGKYVILYLTQVV